MTDLYTEALRRIWDANYTEDLPLDENQGFHDEDLHDIIILIHKGAIGWLTDSDRRCIIQLAEKYLPGEVSAELQGQQRLWGG